VIAYAKTGDFPEALVKILLTIMMNSSRGGATMEELKEAYQEARGSKPSSRTIMRAIRRLNLIFDPLVYGETPEEGEEPDDEGCTGEGENMETLPPMIQTKRTKDGFRYLYTGEYPRSSLDANQVLMMTLGLYTQQRGLLKDHFESVIREMMRDMLARINAYQNMYQELEKHVHVSGYGPADPGRNFYKIKEVMRAIRNHKRIRMEYLRVYDGTLTRREVEPYGMICRFNNWYLVAHCLQQQKRRIFLMDHVKQLKVVENSSFSQPEGFDLNIYNSAWGVWTMDEGNKAEAETVRLKAIKGIAERFKMVCFHDSQKVKMLEGDEAEVTFKVTGAVEMIPWLMSWGATVQVLEPQWLKDQLLQSLRETIGVYEAGN